MKEWGLWRKVHCSRGKRRISLLGGELVLGPLDRACKHHPLLEHHGLCEVGFIQNCSSAAQ